MAKGYSKPEVLLVSEVAGLDGIILGEGGAKAGVSLHIWNEPEFL